MTFRALCSALASGVPADKRVLDVSRCFRRFNADKAGNIGLLFAAMLVPTVGLLGLSVDYGRAANHRAVMQLAVDSAVLAAGRSLQVDNDEASATLAARDIFDAKMEGYSASHLVIDVDTENHLVSLAADSEVPTTFAGVLGIKTIEVSVSAQSALAAGGIDKNVEISLMLDVTGSMCQPCSKLTDLKSAAKDLVNIVVQDDQSKYTSRVALVPFSHAVNVGSAYFKSVTGEEQEVEDQYSYPPSCYRNGRLRRSCEGNPDYLTVVGHSYSSCVVERRGSHKFTDAFPTDENGHANNNDDFLGIFDKEKADSHGGYVDEDTACKPEARIVPLSSDKAGIADVIDELEASGSTAGQIGTAWAWYLLSPNWSSLWPADSRAAEYGDDQTVKIAILMTDGDYNTAYQTGNGSSSSQAKQVCREMKQSGVTVYTVGFMVGSSAKRLLEDCATSSSHFYDAANGQELKLAFRNIAFTVANLRLSK